MNGLYDLRLTATDLLGRPIRDTIQVTVDGAMKIGNFALAFEDLSVPMAGLPIQVIRSYDSRDSRVGDFGTGWSLAIHDSLQKVFARHRLASSGCSTLWWPAVLQLLPRAHWQAPGRGDLPGRRAARV